MGLSISVLNPEDPVPKPVIIVLRCDGRHEEPVELVLGPEGSYTEWMTQAVIKRWRIRVGDDGEVFCPDCGPRGHVPARRPPEPRQGSLF